ncbi:MAG: cobalamin adenosyltransferase [Acetobacterium sp.]|nr:cobalamin adenosyltransferase [Bacillota bacterium]MCG2728939.1 cobalamin adenosyltransferase [Acetobacterium sp.]
MNLITEDLLKKIIKSGQSIENNELRLPENSMLTPSAKSLLADHKLKLILIDETEAPPKTNVMETAATLAAKKTGRFTLESGGYLDDKPEYMTQVYGNLLVNKDHKRIKLRGEIDLLMGEIMKVQIRAKALERNSLVTDLQEVFNYIGELSRSEILDEALSISTILGFNEQEIRAMSHNPKKYFNHEHLFNITYELGEIPILLNSLRALIRKTEVACYEAFKRSDGTVARGDLMQGYNRLSSVMYIMIFRHLDH